MYTALTLRSVCSSSSLRPAMSGVEGSSPRVLWGSRGPFSHVREWSLCPFPCTVRGIKTKRLRRCSPFRARRCPKPRSRAYVASAEPRSALKSGRNALHSHPLLPAAQDTFSVIYLEGKNDRILRLRAYAVGKRHRRHLPWGGARHRRAAGLCGIWQQFLLAAGKIGISECAVIAVEALLAPALPLCLRQRQAGGQDGDVLPTASFFPGKIFSPASNADAPSCASSPFFHLGQSMPPRPKRCGARKCGRGTLLISHTLLNYMGYLQKGRRRAWTATKLSPRPTTS